MSSGSVFDDATVTLDYKKAQSKLHFIYGDVQRYSLLLVKRQILVDLKPPVVYSIDSEIHA